MSKTTERRVLTGEERARERKLILDGNWPHFPLLPVERDDSDESMGTQIGAIAWRYVPGGNDAERSVTVYLGNLLSLSPDVSIGDQFKDWEKIRYATLEEFFDDGWRGD